MRTVIADKIASVAQDRGLKRKLQVSEDIPCEEGVLIAVEILNSKSSYNTLELTSGRMAKIRRGDIIVGALGQRKALFGYSGHLPEKLAAGDTVQVLNIGGVLGIHCREEMELPIPVVSIDGIDLKEFDYIDIGALIPSSGAVPVVIKSLIFPQSAALGR